jgi:hypothetical protein
MFHVIVQNIMKVVKKPYSVTLVNPVNTEEWICEDYNDVRVIDGVEYVKVRKPTMQRTVLMRKDVLRKK